MKTFAVLALLAGAFATPLQLVERQTPDPNQIYIISSQTSGSGCPQGTVSTTLSTDRHVITFGFDSFQTYIGPGTAPADHSKNCQIHLDLHYPGGFQFSVMQATYHGYALMDAGVKGSFISTYFFSQNASATTTTRADISGPIDQVYTKIDNVQQASLVWSPCGTSGIVNANNRITLTSRNSSASGSLTDDDATVSFQQILLFQWRPCNR